MSIFVTRVLVTGGTGFVGSNLTRALVNDGIEVRILRRERSELRALGQVRVEHAIGDVRDYESVRRAVHGCDIVYHTAAMVSYWKKQRSEMFEINIGGTANIVRACLEGGVRKLIHTSSIAAIGHNTDGSPADEETPFNWDRHNIGYRISKHKAEEVVLEGVKNGLFAVMVNPSIIMGPGDIHFHGGQIIRDVRRKRIFYYVKGGANIVFVGDVVRGHLAAAELGKTGSRYILGGENLTHRDILTTVAEVVEGIRPLMRLPHSIVRLLATASEEIANLTNRKPWIPRELAASMPFHTWFSSAKATRELGFSSTPFRKTVALTYQWYLDNGLLT